MRIISIVRMMFRTRNVRPRLELSYNDFFKTSMWRVNDFPGDAGTFVEDEMSIMCVCSPKACDEVCYDAISWDETTRHGFLDPEEKVRRRILSAERSFMKVTSKTKSFHVHLQAVVRLV